MTKSKSSKRSAKRSKRRQLSRPEQLVDFLQDVALGKRRATEVEIEEAQTELDKYLPNLLPEEVTDH